MTEGHAFKSSNRRKELQTDVYQLHGGSVYASDKRFPKSIQVFSTDTQKSNLHPTQKPVALIEYFIKTYSKKGDVILDFTAGSMTTGIAAHNLDRICYLAEKDLEIFNKGKNRLINHIENYYLDQINFE